MISKKKKDLIKLTYFCTSLMSIILPAEVQAMDYVIEDTITQIRRRMRPRNEDVVDEVVKNVNDGIEDIITNIEREVIHPIERVLNNNCNIL